VLMTGRLQSDPRRGVLGAEVSGFASHLDVLPPSGVLERMTIGCLNAGAGVKEDRAKIVGFAPLPVW
jgi:hypothetical protein